MSESNFSFLPPLSDKFAIRPSTYALTLSLSDTIVWALNHDTTGSEAESWNNTIQKEEVLATIDRKTGM